MLDIQPQLLTLAKLLNDRLFYIPNYQRAYSWTERQRKDLFEDIKRVDSKGDDHYMAAIVCLRKNEKRIQLGTDEFDQLDIVDGQQRLTTLIILLNAIKNALKTGDDEEQKIAKDLEELLVKPHGQNLLLLQTNHDASHYFRNYLLNGTVVDSEKGQTLADRELLKAIEECRKFVENWQNNTRDLAVIIKNRLSFILHEISDEKMVYTVFEVLNSRGIAVSGFDKLKSIIMGKAFELENANNEQLINELHTIWRDIYAQVGLHQGLSTEALRFAATLYLDAMPSRPLSEEDAVDTLRSAACDEKNIKIVAHWLLNVTKACDAVISNPRLNAVTRIGQARMLAVALYLRKNFTNCEREKLLVRWEKVTFRIYGLLRKDARTGVGSYVSLAWQIVNEENLSTEDIHTSIREIGNEFSIENAIKHIRDSNNCYENWKDELRYFMFRYEEYLANEQGLNFKNEQWEKIWAVTPSKSIEHIKSQNKASEDIKHNLGNLMLLPPNLNSKLKDTAFSNKKKSYRQFGLLIAEEVIEKSRWGKKEIRKREDKLLDWASKEWRD